LVSIVGISGVPNVFSVTDGKAGNGYPTPSVPDPNPPIVLYHHRLPLVTKCPKASQNIAKIIDRNSFYFLKG
jgi:hypothetical protein